MGEPTLDLKPAFQIAVEVHGTQLDRGGMPYLFHICRVASAMTTNEERAVAILHDVIEDAPDAAKLRMGNCIYDRYGVAIGDACVALTHLQPETYTEYIERVGRNPLALKVKLADLLDNMRGERLEKLPPEDRVRLGKKYQEAYAFLAGVTA